MEKDKATVPQQLGVMAVEFANIIHKMDAINGEKTAKIKKDKGKS